MADTGILVYTLVMITIPVIVLGFILQYTFGVKLGWFPVAGIQDGWKSYVLPSLTLGLGSRPRSAVSARSNIWTT